MTVTAVQPQFTGMQCMREWHRLLGAIAHVSGFGVKSQAQQNRHIHHPADAHQDNHRQEVISQRWEDESWGGSFNRSASTLTLVSWLVGR